MKHQTNIIIKMGRCFILADRQSFLEESDLLLQTVSLHKSERNFALAFKETFSLFENRYSLVLLKQKEI